MVSSFRTLIVGFVVLTTLLLSYKPDAAACGGLFEEEEPGETTTPFLQEAEGVVFVADGAGTVTALVHIAHTGGARRFAWLLPVPGTPEIGLSTRKTFEHLLERTAPRFRVERHDCPVNSDGSKSANATTGNHSANAMGGNNMSIGDGGVRVLDKGVVGPYIYDTITVEGGGDANGEIARTWLTDNAYWVDDDATTLLGSYLDAGMNIIAFKLESGAGAEDIRPVSLRMQGDDIMLPLRLASVGAVEDTELRVWILGSDPAVPSNVPDVELNECIFDWSHDVRNYDDVLGAAVDEAGGLAFVTEFAGQQSLDQVAYSYQLTEKWQQAQRLADDGRQLVNYLASGFAAEDGMRAALREVSVEVDFDCAEYADPMANNMATGEDCILLLPQDFVAQDLLDAVETLVIEPARQTQDLLDSQRVLTSLYTRVSPGEMIADPMFALNPDRPLVRSDLGQWNTEIEAHEYPECSGSAKKRARSRWDLPGGCVVWTDGPNWPLSTKEMPAAARIVQYSESGAPDVLEDNREEIQDTVDDHNGPLDGCNCRVASGPDPGTVPWVIAVVMGGLWRRRRKRTEES